jgi:alpha-ketoglutarate-dependent taurine dioxygenase
MQSASEVTSLADDPRSWTAATVGDISTWTHQLSPRFISTLTLIDKSRGQRSGPITVPRWSAEEKDLFGGQLAAVKRELEFGRGFVILDRLPVGRISDRKATGIYWLIGQLLGEPVVQNVEGTLLYDVRDTGRQLAQGARFSVTNYDSGFHTDNSFGDTVVDYVGLLCLKTAKSGGISQVVSGPTAQEVLRREYPQALETLCRPFHVDRRGGVREGEAPTVLRPAIEFERSATEPLFRYLRYWIEDGHDKAGVPLTPSQRDALDRLDEVLSRPALRAEFSLEPGQVYFINNRWILHNRTAFEDFTDPKRRRHLVRLWLERAHAPRI